MRRVAETLAALLAAALGAAAPALADTVTLKGSVRLPPGAREVRLADIAKLDGAHAQSLAETVITSLSGDGEALEITIQQVRRMLSDAGAHWGKVQLSGRTVIVRPPGTGGVSPARLMAPASVSPPARPLARSARTRTSESAQELIELATLRGAVARTMAAGVGIDPDSLRLSFDVHDRDFLDTPLDAFRFEIQPLSSFRSDRIELSVRAWQDGRIRQSRTITVRPTLRTNVALLRRALERGDEVREEDLSVEARWLTPSQAGTYSTLVQAVGRIAAIDLPAGEQLRSRHLKRTVLIKRGDRVMVRCLVGGVVITLEAEARSDGAEGEQLELRKLGERQTFFASVTGPGAAVLDLTR